MLGKRAVPGGAFLSFPGQPSDGLAGDASFRLQVVHAGARMDLGLPPGFVLAVGAKLMNSAEVFYLHIQGEQRGPYTVPQIDHLVNSGLITEETMYWREGLEQWQPVTELVHKREPKKRWGKTSLLVAAALLVALLVHLFGPITLAGWRETNQYEFTREAAYWRAREVVRSQVLPRGAVVEFCAPERAEVQLQAGTAASVRLRGEVGQARGRPRESAWEVQLRFDSKARQWSGAGARETAP